jgi:hypothetical protein
MAGPTAFFGITAAPAIVKANGLSRRGNSIS